MNPSDFQSKNERSKKYAAFDINSYYHSNTSTQAKPVQKNRYGLQRVGQVQGTRRTPKASWIPSVQAETGIQMRSMPEDSKDNPSSSTSASNPQAQKSATDSSSLSWRKVVTASLPGERSFSAEENETARVQTSMSAAAWMENRRLRQEALAGVGGKSAPTTGATNVSKTANESDSGEVVSKAGPPQSIRLQSNVPNKFLNSGLSVSQSSGGSSAARVPFSQTAVSAGKEKSADNAAEELRSTGKADNVSSSPATSTSMNALMPDVATEPIARGMSTADYYSSGWAAIEDDEPFTSISPPQKTVSQDVAVSVSSSMAHATVGRAQESSSTSTMSAMSQPHDTASMSMHPQAYGMPYQQPRSTEHFQPMAYMMPPGLLAQQMPQSSSHPLPSSFAPTSQHYLPVQAQTGAYYSGEPDKSTAYAPPVLTQIQPLYHGMGTGGGGINEPHLSSGPSPLMASSWTVSGSVRHSSAIGGEWATPSSQNAMMRSSYIDHHFVDNEERDFHETDKQQAYREAVRKGKSKKMQMQDVKNETSSFSEKPATNVGSDSSWRGSDISSHDKLLPGSRISEHAMEKPHVPPISQSSSQQNLPSLNKGDSEKMTSSTQKQPSENLPNATLPSSKASFTSQDARSRNSSATGKTQSAENYSSASFDRGTKKVSAVSSHDKHSQYAGQDGSLGRSYGYRGDYRKQQEYYDEGYYQDQSRSSYRQQSGHYYNKAGNTNAGYDTSSGVGYYNKSSARTLRDEYANEYYSRYGSTSKNAPPDSKTAPPMSHGKEGVESKGSVNKAEKTSSSGSNRDKSGRGNYEVEEFGEVWIDESDHNIPTKGAQRQQYGGYRSGSRYSSGGTRGAVISRGGRGFRGAYTSSYQRTSPDKYEKRTRTNDSKTRPRSPPRGTSSQYDTRLADATLTYSENKHETEDTSRSSTTPSKGVTAMTDKHGAAGPSNFYHTSQSSHTPLVVPLLTETECQSLIHGKHKSGPRAYSGDTPPSASISTASHAGKGAHSDVSSKKNVPADRMNRDSKVEGHAGHGSAGYREDANLISERPSSSRLLNKPFASREGRRGTYRSHDRTHGMDSGYNLSRGHLRKRNNTSTSENRRSVRGASQEKGKLGSDDEEGEEISLWETASEGSDVSGAIQNSGDAHKVTSNAASTQRPTVDNDASGKSSFHRNNHPRGGGGSGSSGSAGNASSNVDSSGKSYTTSVAGGGKSESGSQNGGNQGAKGSNQRATTSHAGNSPTSSTASQSNNNAMSTSEGVAATISANLKDATSQRPPRQKIQIDTSAYSNVVLADSLPQVTEEELYLEAISNAVDCDLIQSDVLNTVENVLGFQEVLSKATKRNRKRQEEQAEQQRIQSEKDQKPAAITSPTVHDNEKTHRVKVQDKGAGGDTRFKTIVKRDSTNGGRKESISKEPMKNAFATHRPAPVGPPTPLLDAQELLAVQPHSRHVTSESTPSLPPRLSNQPMHHPHAPYHKSEKKSFKNSIYEHSNDSSSQSNKQITSSVPTSHSQTSQSKKATSNDLVSIDEWKSTDSTADSKSSMGPSIEISAVNITQELVSVPTSVFETSRHTEVASDHSVNKESTSRSNAERVVWEMCETLMGAQSSLAAATCMASSIPSSNTLSENGDQNNRALNQRTRSTSASTCKSAASMSSVSHGVSGANFMGTNNNANGHLSPTLANVPSNICKVKPQQQMIHEEEASSFCVTLNDAREGTDSTSNFQMSVNSQLPSWSGGDGVNSGTVTETETVLSLGSGIQALQLETRSEQTNHLNKASLLELQSELPNLQFMEQVSKFNASQGVLYDGSELFSASTYVVTYPNTMMNPEYQPGLSTEVMWPNAGFDAFQSSTSKSLENSSGSRMNFLGNVECSMSFNSMPNNILLSSNSPATMSPSTATYPSLVNMGSSGASLFNPLLQHQVANPSFLAATLPPSLGGNQIPNMAAAYPPHAQGNSAPPTAGLNQLFSGASVNSGYAGAAGTQLDANAASMQHFYAMLQQQPQLQSAGATCPTVAGLIPNFPAQPLISPAPPANHNPLINAAHANAFLRQDSQPMATPPTAQPGTPQPSAALFMFNPQAAPPPMSILPTAAPNAAQSASRTNYFGSGFTHAGSLHPATGAMMQLGTGAPTPPHVATRGTPRYSTNAVSLGDYQSTAPSIDILSMGGGGAGALFAPPLNLFPATPAPVTAPSLFSSASGFSFKALPPGHGMTPQASVLSTPQSVFGNYVPPHQQPLAANMHSPYNKSIQSAYSSLRPSLTPSSLLNGPNFLTAGTGARLTTPVGHQPLHPNQGAHQGRNYNTNNSLLPSNQYENPQFSTDVLPHMMPTNDFKALVQMSRFKAVNSGRINAASLLPSFVDMNVAQSPHSSATQSKGGAGGGSYKRHQNHYYHRSNSSATTPCSSATTHTGSSSGNIKGALEKAGQDGSGDATGGATLEADVGVPGVDNIVEESKQQAITLSDSSCVDQHSSTMSLLSAPLQTTALRNE